MSSTARLRRCRRSTLPCCACRYGNMKGNPRKVCVGECKFLCLLVCLFVCLLK
jgi:hypothetical protein